MGAVRELKPVLLRQGCVIGVAARFVEGFRVFLVVDVAQPLQKEKWKDE